MKRIIYSSSALIDETSPQALDILRAALQFNQAHHITGCLHRENWNFYQCLEGPVNTVNNLMEKIRQDKRHCAVQILEETAISKRSFKDWQISYFSNHRFSLANWRQIHKIDSSAALTAQDIAGFLLEIASYKRQMLDQLPAHPVTLAEPSTSTAQERTQISAVWPMPFGTALKGSPTLS
ncbi:MAG: BLUF domain-containing protein [Mangrovicoccus sp.]